MLCCLRSIPFYCRSLWSDPSLVNSSAIISLPGRYCISTGMFCSSPSISLHSFRVITCSFVYANRGWWSTWNITFFPFRVQYRRFLAALAMVRNCLSNVVAFLSASLKSPPLNSSICSSPWWSTWWYTAAQDDVDASVSRCNCKSGSYLLSICGTIFSHSCHACSCSVPHSHLTFFLHIRVMGSIIPWTLA